MPRLPSLVVIFTDATTGCALRPRTSGVSSGHEDEGVTAPHRSLTGRIKHTRTTRPATAEHTRPSHSHSTGEGRGFMSAHRQRVPAHITEQLAGARAAPSPRLASRITRPHRRRGLRAPDETGDRRGLELAVRRAAAASRRHLHRARRRRGRRARDTRGRPGSSPATPRTTGTSSTSSITPSTAAPRHGPHRSCSTAGRPRASGGSPAPTHAQRGPWASCSWCATR